MVFFCLFGISSAHPLNGSNRGAAMTARTALWLMFLLGLALGLEFGWALYGAYHHVG